MATKPIIFSAPMVRALLDGRKTQTRRILKPQPEMHPQGDCTMRGHRGSVDYLMREIAPQYWAPSHVGDLLWVRESITRFDKGTCDQWVWYRAGRNYDGSRPADERWIKAHFPDQDGDEEWGAATGPACGAPYHVSPIHMPRWASRLTLRVTAVKVERVQEISPKDAIAEGLIHKPGIIEPHWWMLPEPYHQGTFLSPVEAFRWLWNSINCKRPGCSWSDNPWCAAIGFDVIRENVDRVIEREAA